MTPEAAADHGDRLLRARTRREPCAPPSATAALSLADAYRVLRATVDCRLRAGGWIAGYKAALTSAEQRARSGAVGPVIGVLLHRDVLRDGDEIAFDSFLQPMAEVEVAVVLHEVPPSPFTVGGLVASGATLAPAVELVDSRMGWEGGIPAFVADNSAAAAAVVGPAAAPADYSLAGLTACLDVGGEALGTGDASAVTGGPLGSAAWMCTAVSRLGLPLEPGHVLLTGALAGPVPLGGPALVTGSIVGLGAVTTRIT